VSRLGLVGSVELGLGLVTSLGLGLRVSVSVSGSGVPAIVIFDAIVAAFTTAKASCFRVRVSDHVGELVHCTGNLTVSCPFLSKFFFF